MTNRPQERIATFVSCQLSVKLWIVLLDELVARYLQGKKNREVPAPLKLNENFSYMLTFCWEKVERLLVYF